MKKIQGCILRPMPLLCGLFALTVSGFAQATGAIHGSVYDASHAAVPGARLTVTNLNTSQSRTLISGDAGQYLASLLTVGNYSVRVEKEGFTPLLQTGIVVQVNTDVQVDATLEVGTAATAVTVSANPMLVQTTTTNMVQVVDQRRIVDLPLNGRNVLQLVALDAGVTNDPRVSTNVIQVPTVGQGFYQVVISANGSRQNGTNFILDDVDNNDNYTNINAPYPNPDAVQEFSIQTSAFDAQYGERLGGVVNVVTKAGSNEFHGSTFDFFRNYDLNARNFFSGKDALKRNQFGSTLGGPVSLPTVYKGKNRTFFLGSYQGTRQRIATPKLVTAPSAAMEQGDFSSWLLPNGTGAIHDPLSPTQYFPGNRIPTARFDPVAVKMLAYMPTSSTSNYQLWLPVPSAQLDDNEFVGRIDHIVSAAQRISVRYFGLNYNNPWQVLPNDLFYFNIGSKDTYSSVVINHTYLFSPQLLNEFNLGFHRSTTLIDVPQELTNCCSLFGFGARALPSVPSVTLGISSWTGFAEGMHRDQYQTTYLLGDNVSYTFGRHQLRFGGNVERYRIDYTSDSSSGGNITFSGQLFSDPGKNNAGNSFAEFLLGTIAALKVNSVNLYRQYNDYVAMYVQDDIRLAPKLTLNIGLRWAPTFLPWDKYHQSTTFIPGLQSTVFPNAPPGLLFYGDPGISDPLVSDWKTLAPRFGIAYQVMPRTVIRAAYGIFWDEYGMITRARTVQAPPWVDMLNTTATGTLSNPYGNGPLSNWAFRKPTKDYIFNPYNVYAIPSPDLVPGYMQNWNLVVERQLFKDLLLRGAYVGSKGVHLLVTAEINPAIYGPGATVANENQRRIYQPIGGLQLGEGAGWSKYQAAQFTLEKRFSRGFTVVANYTVSKSIDIASYGSIETNTIGPDPFDWNKNRGPSDFDCPQRLVVSSVWVHPELKGKNGLMRAVLGGWQSNVIFTAAAGLPLTILSGTDNALSGVGGDFASLTSTSWRLPDDRPKGDEIRRWFNTAGFVVNSIGMYGTGGRNQLRVPGMWNCDYSLFKNFALREHAKFQFRGEFFNVFNHANLGAPGNSVLSTTFGQITTARDPRIVQLSLRFVF